MAPLTWLITGCSSGYGEYLAEIAAERGENVIATARKPEKIASRITEKPNVKVLQLDLTESSTSIAKKVEKALELFGGIDVLVNNAGYPCVGPFEEIREEDAAEYMATAVSGPMHLIRSILPYFRTRRAGHLIYMSSMYSFGAQGPGSSYYIAAKHAIAGFAKALDNEVAQFNIKSILLDAGFFKSKMIGKIDIENEFAKPKIADYEPLFQATGAAFAQIDQNNPGDPIRMAKVTVDLVKGTGVAKGKDVPLSLPLGSDAAELSKQVAEERLDILEKWGPVMRSTDYASTVSL